VSYATSLFKRATGQELAEAENHSMEVSTVFVLLNYNFDSFN
jgi:hypothetical protein